MQIISPGTKALDGALEPGSPEAPTAIVALSTSLNGKSIAVAAVDLGRGTFQLGELHGCDAARTHLSLALHHLFPAEILHDGSLDKGGLNAVKQYATSNPADRVAVRRRAALEDGALESASAAMRSAGAGEFDRISGHGARRHVLAAAALASQVLEQAGLSGWLHGACSLREYSLHEPGAGSGVTPVDAATLTQLSVFRGSASCPEGSLFSILNETSTRLGARMLREWLSAPLNEVGAIVHRQEAVSALSRLQPRAREDLHAALSMVKADVETQLSRTFVTLSEWLEGGELDADDAMVLFTEPLGHKFAKPAADEGDRERGAALTQRETLLKSAIEQLTALVDALSLLSGSSSRVRPRRRAPPAPRSPARESEPALRPTHPRNQAIVGTSDALAEAVHDVAAAAEELDGIRSVLRDAESATELDDADLEARGRLGALLCDLKWARVRERRVEERLERELAAERSAAPQGVGLEFCNQSRHDYSVIASGKRAASFEPPASWAAALAPAHGAGAAKKKASEKRKFRVPAIEALSDQLMDAHAEATAARIEVVRLLSAEFVDARTWRTLLFRAGEIDVYASLLRSIAALNEKFGLPVCMPEFVEQAPARRARLEASGAWSPILTRSMRQGAPAIVLNDVGMVAPGAFEDAGAAGSCIVLTGPNMSGKSTYMRLCGTLALMAHIGAPVPAATMRLCVVDRILSRMGSDDCIEAGESTFMLEMNQTNFLLRNASESSLVLVDELGRGTSTYDGFSIAYAVLVHLVRELRCRTIFSTHYHGIVREILGAAGGGGGGGGLSADEGVVLAHMHCSVSESDLVPSFEMRVGPSPLESCGIMIARKCGMPTAVIANASRRSASMKDAAGGARPKRRRGSHGQHPAAAPLSHDERAWLRDLTDDDVIRGARAPDPEFHGDFVCFWRDVHKRLSP